MDRKTVIQLLNDRRRDGETDGALADRIGVGPEHLREVLAGNETAAPNLRRFLAGAR